MHEAVTPVSSTQRSTHCHAPFTQSQASAAHCMQFGSVQAMRQPSGAGDSQPGAAHAFAQQSSVGAQPAAQRSPG